MANNLRAVFEMDDKGSITLKQLNTTTKNLKKSTDQVTDAAAEMTETIGSGAKASKKKQDDLTKAINETARAYGKNNTFAGAYYDTLGKLHAATGQYISSKGAPEGIPVRETAENGNPILTSGGGFSGGAINTALNFAAAGVAAKKAWDGAMSAINLSAMQKVQETTFQALLNHKAAGSALYDWVSAYAKVSALGREDIANAVTSYSAYTKNADQLERMIKLTERLYAKDPKQGSEGAVFAMRELLSGDTMSIKDRFNMSGFSGEAIRNFANTGDIEGMLDYVDQMFNRFGATQEVVDANFDNLITQTNIFSSNLKTAIAESATPAMETLSGVMKQLNKDMDAGKYQPFINMMATGMKLIGNGVAWVADNINWLAPAVVGITSAFIIYKGVQMAVAAGTMIVATATNLMTGNFLSAAAGAAALVGGLAAVAAVSEDIDLQTTADLESAKKAYADIADTLPAFGAALPVEVSNSAPIKVKGEVEIEEESLRYMLDIQGQKWLAKYSTATIAPQNIFNGVVIRETVDFEEFTQMTIDSLKAATETTAAGIY